MTGSPEATERKIIGRNKRRQAKRKRRGSRQGNQVELVIMKGYRGIEETRPPLLEAPGLAMTVIFFVECQ